MTTAVDMRRVSATLIFCLLTVSFEGTSTADPPTSRASANKLTRSDALELARAAAQREGIDVSKYTSETVPVIFNVNLRDPGGFFLTTKVMMKNGDVIYVSNSRNVEVTKFLQFLRVIMATGSDAVNLSNDALIFRNNVKLAP